jgi:integrase/recombinase XerD
VRRLAEAAREGRKGERDELLIQVLFQTGLRISEALTLTPAKIRLFDGKPALEIKGKRGKPRLVACPQRLCEQLQAYAYRKGLKKEDRFFNINRKRAWQIISEAGKRVGLGKRVYPHLLRHSDAIERLRQTGNPKALQIHLGHSSVIMTMRYLSTLTAEDALRIQQEVSFELR